MPQTRSPYRVGVTGSLGSGKSTLCGFLARRGIPVVDADQVSREVTAAGSAVLDALRREFGPEIIDGRGQLDRAALARRAFEEPSARERLERIVHPPIRAALAAAFETHARAGHDVVVVEAALILESGRGDEYDMLVVVTAPDPVKIERATTRGMSSEDARRRLARQWPDERKIEAADWVVYNDGDLVALEHEAERLAVELRARAR